MNRLVLDRHGWLQDSADVQRLPSPNHDARPNGDDAFLLVMHNISLPPGIFGGTEVIDLFLNRLDYASHPWLPRLRGLKVSAHFLVRRDGEIVQFVPTTQARLARRRIVVCRPRTLQRFFDRHRNGRHGHHALRRGTIPRRCTGCCRHLRTRHPLRAVRGHEHIAPGRKTDPGPTFDWNRFGRENGWLRRQLPPV